MRTSLCSMTCFLKPAKLPGPAEPVSTAVVTPLRRQKSSASIDKRCSAPIDVRMQVDQTGRDDEAGDITHVVARSASSLGADRRDLASGEGHIGDAIETLRGIDDATALQDQIIGHW